MKVIVSTEKVKGERGDCESRNFYQAVVKYQETVMRLPPGKSVSALGLTGKPEQLWLSVAGGSCSSLFCFNDSSVGSVCNIPMYVTDILPIDPNLILLAGSASDHYRVEIWPIAGGLPIQVARFVRPVGGGNPDTGQATYPTFGIVDGKITIGWRLREKGGTCVGFDALSEKTIFPLHQPFDDFDLTRALTYAWVDVTKLLEACNEEGFCRHLSV